jgi:hypothetical protein
MKAFCRTFVLEVDIYYLVRRHSPIAPDVMKILTCPNKVTELYKVGCCESKISGAMVNNIIFVARLLRCRKEEKHSSVVRVTFLGTTIVVPIHLVHPLRWGFASPAKLVPVPYVTYGTGTIVHNGSRKAFFKKQRGSVLVPVGVFLTASTTSPPSLLTMLLTMIWWRWLVPVRATHRRHIIVGTSNGPS